LPINVWKYHDLRNHTTAGAIRIDGHNLALMSAASLRRNIGVVLQENVLFSGTIGENIAMAMPAASMEKIMHAAGLAGAHEFISEFPAGYDTLVGEHGATLSGGQRQRIAIARALITDPKILIFDEATSALDYESEQVIHRNLKLIARDRTVLIIAHRLAAVRDAHRILVLDRGVLVEQGPPHELLARDAGHYAALYKLQYL
jgi:subfamily B ATP-binding cassette protein HlyB/CyaB